MTFGVHHRDWPFVVDQATDDVFKRHVFRNGDDLLECIGFQGAGLVAVDHQGELHVQITGVAPNLDIVFRVWNANKDLVNDWISPMNQGGDTTGGNDLGEATSEALNYLDRCLDAGFRPGMGHIIPDRMFWAQPDDDESEDSEADSLDETQAIEGFVMPPHDTKH